jgi:NAD(P)-dependent dehydrogenase (short-subunit alcohol dehydrogenase family)
MTTEPSRSHHALVTGGANGLGAACADRFRDAGIRVTTVDVAPGADIIADVSDEQAVLGLVRELSDVDILVNNAGIIGEQGPMVDLSLEGWVRTMTTNATSTFLMSRAFAPAMVQAGWGRIINVASIAGKEGAPHIGPYSASKAAVISITKTLGYELATTGVLVNAVAPAIITSAINAATAPEVLERSMSLIPMGRAGLPSEFAELVAWLASEACSFSTGFTYDLSGGRAKY